MFFMLNEDQPQRDACKQMSIASSRTRFSLRRGVKFPAAETSSARHAREMLNSLFDFSLSRGTQSE
jgi:hypothetical protein